MDAYRFWQVGSLSEQRGRYKISIAIYIIVGLIISVIFMHALNALALGDEVATGLGVNTGLVRIMCAIAGVILCGATTANSWTYRFYRINDTSYCTSYFRIGYEKFNTNVCYRWGNL